MLVFMLELVFELVLVLGGGLGGGRDSVGVGQTTRLFNAGGGRGVCGGEGRKWGRAAALKVLMVVVDEVKVDTSGLRTPKYGSAAALKIFVGGGEGEGVRTGDGNAGDSVVDGDVNASGFFLEIVGNGGCEVVGVIPCA